MSLQSPFTTKVEKGGYSAIVTKVGSLFIAQDEEGTIIVENTDASTVIQAAIDGYAEYGQVIVIPAVTLTSTIKIHKKFSQVKFLAQISSQGVDAFEMGDDTHDGSYSTLELNFLNGIDKSAHGIVFKRCTSGRVFFDNIAYCDIGMYFNPTAVNGEAGNNYIQGPILGNSNTGVKFTSSARWMEGNRFYTGINACDTGFELVSGGNSKYQIFHGYIDCLPNDPSYDLKDYTGYHTFILGWIRQEKCIIEETTFLQDMNCSDQNHCVMRAQSPINFLNIDFKAIAVWDFNRDSTGDWTKTNCSMAAPSKSVTRLTASAADWYITRSTNFNGGENYIMLIGYKIISGGVTAGTVFYSTAGHAFSASYYKDMKSLIGDGKWHLHALDMRDLALGGTDWIDNVITGLRLDFTQFADTVMDLDFIAIGGKGHGAMCYADGAIELYETGDKIKLQIPKTPASAGASGNTGDICWDANFVYVCVATDTWKRVAIAAW